MRAFDKLQASIFGGVSQSKLNILQNEMNNITTAMNNLGNRFTGSMGAIYQRFKDNIVNRHQELFNSRKLREVNDYLASGQHSIEDGFLHRLNRTNYILNNDTKDFVLAHPSVYRMHGEGILHEFGNHNLIDRSISTPEFMTEYIETYDGVIRNVEDKIGEVSHYVSTLEFRKLSLPEVCVRMDIWNEVSEMLLDGLDPTKEDSF